MTYAFHCLSSAGVYFLVSIVADILVVDGKDCEIDVLELKAKRWIGRESRIDVPLEMDGASRMARDTTIRLAMMLINFLDEINVF